MPTPFDDIKPVAPRTDLAPLVSAGGQPTPTTQAPVSGGGSPVNIPLPTTEDPSFFDKLVKALPGIGKGLQEVGAAFSDTGTGLKTGVFGTQGAQIAKQRAAAAKNKRLGEQFQLEFQRKKNEFKQELAIKKTNSDGLARWRMIQGSSALIKSLDPDDPFAQFMKFKLVQTIAALVTEGTPGGLELFQGLPEEGQIEFIDRVDDMATSRDVKGLIINKDKALAAITDSGLQGHEKTIATSIVMKAFNSGREDLTPKVERDGDGNLRAFDPDTGFFEIIQSGGGKKGKSLKRIEQEALVKARGAAQGGGKRRTSGALEKAITTRERLRQKVKDTPPGIEQDQAKEDFDVASAQVLKIGTGQQFEAEVGPEGVRISSKTGKLPGGTVSRLTAQVDAADEGQALMGRVRELITPQNVGFAGKVKGFIFGVAGQAEAFSALVAEMTANNRADIEENNLSVNAEVFFDPKLPKIRLLLNNLAFALARAREPRARQFSDKDLKNARETLGFDKSLSTKREILAALEEFSLILDRQKTRAQKRLGDTGSARSKEPKKPPSKKKETPRQRLNRLKTEQGELR